ncbi:MAG: hypothetical protein H6900_14250 [Rhodobacter sp.]|nr:hypothetical protein [Rhodobacter sp.]
MNKPSTDLDQLRAVEAELERRLFEVRQQISHSGRKTEQVSGGRRRPLREVMLDLLAEAQVPLNSLLIASILRPLQGLSVASTRFGTLSNDEAKSFGSSRARPVYLCHCLNHDDGQAVKRFWARSDWPISRRILGPMSGRVLFLQGAGWTIELAREASLGELPVANGETLNFVAADQARDAGLKVKRGEFPYDDWLEGLRDLLGRYSVEDEAVRAAAAAELSNQLSERELLFGARQPVVASLPGTKAGWGEQL